MMKFSLKKPIQIGTITIDSLNFRDHTTAGDYLAFDKLGGVSQRIALIANLTGTDSALIEKLYGVDYQRAVEIADKMISDDEDEANPPPAKEVEETDAQKAERETSQKK